MDPAQPARLGFEEDALAAWQQRGDACRPDFDADTSKRNDEHLFDRNGPPRAATFADVGADVRGVNTEATNQVSRFAFRFPLPASRQTQRINPATSFRYTLQANVEHLPNREFDYKFASRQTWRRCVFRG
jgi:hypothetical protein